MRESRAMHEYMEAQRNFHLKLSQSQNPFAQNLSQGTAPLFIPQIANDSFVIEPSAPPLPSDFSLDRNNEEQENQEPLVIKSQIANIDLEKQIFKKISQKMIESLREAIKNTPLKKALLQRIIDAAQKKAQGKEIINGERTALENMEQTLLGLNVSQVSINWLKKYGLESSVVEEAGSVESWISKNSAEKK